MLKKLPDINLANVRPPYDWWHFFENAESHPFKYDAVEFHLMNAWWLIEASALSYSDPELVREQFARVGMPQVHYLNADSTQCFVAGNDDFMMVVFRGTEVTVREDSPNFRNIIADVAADARIKLVPSGRYGRVHQGFTEALDEIWLDRGQGSHKVEGLRTLLNKLAEERKARPIWFTGHSLGAALATLAADRYSKAHGLYTFGSPRVGDVDFKKNFRTKTFRFVNNNDIVAMVPPRNAYHHVGSLKFIDSRHRIQDNPTFGFRLKSRVIGEVLGLSAKIQSLKSGLISVIPKNILDHVPLFYSTHIWNAHLQSRQQLG